MSNFPGGSVYAMVQGVASGAYLVTEKSFKRLLPPEVHQLALELERQLRTARAEQPSLDDLNAVQQRHRTIQRLTSALALLRSHQQRNRGK